MNNFIISGKGFLKTIVFDKESQKHVIEWTQQLRDADKYKTSKTATKIIEKFNLNAFVWNPYKEEPIRGKWEIKQRQYYNTFMDYEKHKVHEWIPERVVMEKKTDLNYLVTKGIDNKTYFDSYEDAVNACKVKNLEILNELQEKIAKMDKEVNNV